MAYTLQPLRGGFDWPTVTALLRDVEAVQDDGWFCWSFSNHDVERAVSRWNPRRGEAAPDPAFARLLMALLLSLRGSICLYQGEELGLTEATLTEDQLRDPFGIAYWPEFRGRDGSRTPMPWRGDAPHGGFTTGTPWLPVPLDHLGRAVDVQMANSGSLLHAYRRFLAWRRGMPALRYGSLRVVPLAEPLVGFVRETDNARLLAVFNLSGHDVCAELPVSGRMAPMTESGFTARLDRNRVSLSPFGVLFAMLLTEDALPEPVLEAR
jgi:alpha-glucosidase